MIPILSGYSSPDGKYHLVWCQYCTKYHRHHARRSSGPLQAHCVDNRRSPYVISGYRLIDAGPAPLQVLLDAGYTTGALAA